MYDEEERALDRREINHRFSLRLLASSARSLAGSENQSALMRVTHESRNYSRALPRLPDPSSSLNI